MNWLSMKAAFQLGLKAARDGEPADANPYPPSVPEFESWADGWRMDIVDVKVGVPKKKDGKPKKQK